MKRVLAIDPGDQRIGIAISDLTRTIANPFGIINHIQREKDAEEILRVSLENNVDTIVIGQALFSDGTPNPSGRKAARLAAALSQITNIPVILWDEFESTQLARKTRKEMGVGKKKLRSHMDDLAATIILQSFLDSKNNDLHISDSQKGRDHEE